MGWVNFIVLPETKILVEVDRDTEGDKDFTSLFDSDDRFYVDQEKKFKDLSIKDMASLIKIQESCVNVNDGEVLFYLLRKYDENVHIISEFDYTKNKEKFKDFVVLRRN